MVENCVNCGEKIFDGGFLAAANHYLSAKDIRFINFVRGTTHDALCEKCGGPLKVDASSKLASDQDELRTKFQEWIPSFPMMTIGVLPGANEFRVLGMVTGNVTVGTGLFNEFSQGVSDMFGAVNTQTGMAGKVNKGEAAARSMLVQKALQMGANCIIGVDIDYGTTGNNAATVNMQGTAVQIPDLAAVLGERALETALWLQWAWQRLKDQSRWARADFQEGETYPLSASMTA